VSKFVPQASKGCARTFKGREHLTSYYLVRYQGKQWLEHRLVMTLHLGRPLLKTEIVHHRDGDGLNNALSNLELTDPHNHNAKHDKMKWDLQEATRLRASGWTFDALGARYGVSWGAVRKSLQRRGVSTQDSRWGKHYWPVDEALKLYAEGFNCTQIGRKLKFPPASLRKLLIKRDLYNQRS